MQEVPPVSDERRGGDRMMTEPSANDSTRTVTVELTVGDLDGAVDVAIERLVEGFPGQGIAGAGVTVGHYRARIIAAAIIGREGDRG
jgi:hypothetical protein